MSSGVLVMRLRRFESENHMRSLKAFVITFITIEVLSLFVMQILIAVRPELSLGSLDSNLLVGGGRGAVLV
jgi:hypothetical protein